MLIGITRVRNEALIIQDTIEHFLARCDHVVLYDDCSTDDTVEIAKTAGGKDITIINGDEWRKDRMAENSRHRAIVLDVARKLGADWCLCFDADERLVGDLPELKGDGFKFRLFDGYLTKTHQSLYTGGDLAQLPRMWGPEYRDILMLFRADKASFNGHNLRPPILSGQKVLADVKVKHFGKCLSIEHWEETCRYYSTYFPARYSNRWNARKGKAIHTASDFNRALWTWNDLMRNMSSWVKIK